MGNKYTRWPLVFAGARGDDPRQNKGEDHHGHSAYLACSGVGLYCGRRASGPCTVARRSLCQSQRRRRLCALRRRSDRAVGGDGEDFQRTLSRHHRLDQRRFLQRARQENRRADRRRQARGRHGDLADHCRLRALESRRPFDRFQAHRLRQDRPPFQGSRRRVLGDNGQCRPLYVQYREGRRRRRAEFSARFPKTAV